MTKEMNKPSDIELAGRAASGDETAFGLLTERHYMLVYRAAFKWCGNREDAEDITHDTLIKLGRAIFGFKGGSSFTTWLYRITVNTAKDFHRGRSAKQAREDAYAGEGPATTRGASPADNPISSARLYSVIDKLPVKYKEAVLLVLSEGLSHKDAALALGCAETTVSWRVFQARRRLKKLLKDEV